MLPQLTGYHCQEFVERLVKAKTSVSSSLDVTVETYQACLACSTLKLAEEQCLQFTATMIVCFVAL
jgi:hypothetical protein